MQIKRIKIVPYRRDSFSIPYQTILQKDKQLHLVKLETSNDKTCTHTGTPTNFACKISTLSWGIALEITTALGTLEPFLLRKFDAEWPTCKRAPASCSLSMKLLHTRSEPLTSKPYNKFQPLTLGRAQYYALFGGRENLVKLRERKKMRCSNYSKIFQNQL